MKTINIPALNSLIFIRDAKLEDVPEIDGQAAYWASESCVAVTCLPDSEGETAIILGSGAEVGRRDTPLLDRVIASPSRVVLVETVLANKILSSDVQSARTRLRIWTNGHRATNILIIALD